MAAFLIWAFLAIVFTVAGTFIICNFICLLTHVERPRWYIACMTKLGRQIGLW